MIPTQQRKNNDGNKSLKLSEIAKLVGGELLGDPELSITGIAGIKEAEKGDITFLANPKYLPYLEQTKASAVITTKDVSSSKKSIIRTLNPSMAFSQVVSVFTPMVISKAPGIHATAVIEKNVHLGQNIHIGPQVVLEEEVSIGDGTVIEAHSFIGRGAVIGNQCQIFPHVTIRAFSQIGNRVILHSGTVVGSDGFGYETIDGVHVKIPQTGIVCIEDDVELGANVCVDRGRFSRTLIKKGTKIDNLVQIAHNVEIGQNCMIVSQAGISGSTVLGNQVVVAGQAGLVGHLDIGNRVIIGAGAGVTKSIPDNTVVLGQPARDITEQKRILAVMARLPELFKELQALKRKMG